MVDSELGNSDIRGQNYFQLGRFGLKWLSPFFSQFEPNLVHGINTLTELSDSLTTNEKQVDERRTVW